MEISLDKSQNEARESADFFHSAFKKYVQKKKYPLDFLKYINKNLDISYISVYNQVYTDFELFNQGTAAQTDKVLQHAIGKGFSLK